MATSHSTHPSIQTARVSHAARTQAIAVSVADVRREPDGGSELVTQALLGAPARRIEAPAYGWARVRLADYEGWVREDDLTRLPRPTESVAVVTATRAPLYVSARGDATLGEAFATTTLPVTRAGQRSGADRTRVALPGGVFAWLAATDSDLQPADAPFPMRGPEAAVALAKRLLDVPYLWGGVTARGIDCSGLSQLACRAGGAVIPRDADQQYESMSWVVDRASVSFGDLVFFASDGGVTHVGIALDNMTLLHASGAGESVIITSLDPAAGEYSAKLAGMYAGARRPFPPKDTTR